MAPVGDALERSVRELFGKNVPARAAPLGVMRDELQRIRPRCCWLQVARGQWALAAGAHRLAHRLALARPPLRVRATRIVRPPRPSLAVAAA